jgi:phosphoribosylformylglycinamidine synthase
MADACKAFETPVTGGNVSFYNETDGRAIYPTPVIGMVGIIEDLSNLTPQSFQSKGDDIVLLGENTAEMGGAEYLYVTAGLVAGEPPRVDLARERQLQRAVLTMIQNNELRSAHDCSEGGLACALAECALGDEEAPFGVKVELDDTLPPVATLFAESQGRIVVSCAPDRTENVIKLAMDHSVPARRIGKVGRRGEAFHVTAIAGQIKIDLVTLSRAYFGALPAIMNTPASSVE